MRHTVLLFGLFAIIGLSVACPPQYQGGGDGFCYKYFLNASSHNAAAGVCNNEGATLVSIQNAFANSFVFGLIRNIQDAWIGYSVNGGVGSWDDGTEASYTNFNSNPPTNSYIPSWVVSASNGRWYQPQNTMRTAFVCKKPDEMAAPCYGWTQRSSQCFKGFPLNLTMSQAESFCNSQCAHLVTVNSQSLNFLLPHLFCPYCSNYPSQVRIGLVETAGNYYQWTDGTPFNPASSYSNFGFIDDSLGKCVSANIGVNTTNPIWMNSDCNRPMAFICEKSSYGCATTLPPLPTARLTPRWGTTRMVSFFLDLSGYSAPMSQTETQINLLEALGTLIGLDYSYSRFVIGGVSRTFTISGNATSVSLIRPLVNAILPSVIYPDLTYNLGAAVDMFDIQGWQYNYNQENPPIAVFIGTREPLGGVMGLLQPAMNDLRTKYYKFLAVDLSLGSDQFVSIDFKQLVGKANTHTFSNVNETASWLAQKIRAIKP